MKQSRNTHKEPLNPEVFSFPDVQWDESLFNFDFDEDFSELTFTPEDLQTLTESMNDFIESSNMDDNIQDFLKREEQELLSLSFETIDTETMRNIKDMLERDDKDLKEFAESLYYMR